MTTKIATTDAGSADRVPSLFELKDAYKGKRCYILGNGPSLNKTDLARLKDEVTIGLNRIYLKFDEIGFSTTFLCCVNDLVLQQFGDDIVRQDSQILVDAKAGPFPDTGRPLYYMTAMPGAGFTPDLSQHTWYPGATVTYAAMQLAYHLGCSEVILLGVDHNFGHSGRAHLVEKSQGNDANHFDPNYFGKDVLWQFPDLVESELNFATARAAFELNGRQIKDATVGGKLTVFPKIGGYALDEADTMVPTDTATRPDPRAVNRPVAEDRRTRIYGTIMNNQHRGLISGLSGAAVAIGGVMLVAVMATDYRLALLVLGCLLMLGGAGAIFVSRIGIDWFSEWSRRRRLREGQVLLNALEILRDRPKT